MTTNEKACASFTHQCNLFSVYANGTAENWHHVKYSRRDDGKWTLANGYHIPPGLNKALEDKYKALVGEGVES